MKKYIHYGSTNFDKSIFCKIRNVDFLTKPQGGLWASDIEAEYSWKTWCQAENFCDYEEENSFLFTLSNYAKVLYINSANDLKPLPKVKDKYGLNFPGWVLLDFEKLAEIYDAIEVNISSDFDLYYQLYGWDCDSIIIMNPNIIIEL